MNGHPPKKLQTPILLQDSEGTRIMIRFTPAFLVLLFFDFFPWTLVPLACPRLSQTGSTNWKVISARCDSVQAFYLLL